jgi:putative acetyltransferase
MVEWVIMITIRAEGKEDIEAIHSVNRMAFGQEDEAALVRRIRESSGFIPALSLVAVKNSRIVGHPEYYPRFGFVPARQKGLDLHFPVPDEAFMVCELEPDALEGINVMVEFPPEFSDAM